MGSQSVSALLRGLWWRHIPYGTSTGAIHGAIISLLVAAVFIDHSSPRGLDISRQRPALEASSRAASHYRLARLGGL